MEQPWPRTVERWACETNVDTAINRPDTSQQVGIGEHSSGVGREFRQLPIRDGRNLDRLTGQAHTALNVVYGRVSQCVGKNPKTANRSRVRCANSLRFSTISPNSSNERTTRWRVALRASVLGNHWAILRSRKRRGGDRNRPGVLRDEARLI